MSTMVRKEIDSPFQIYTLCMSKDNSERNIFTLTGAMVKVTRIPNFLDC